MRRMEKKLKVIVSRLTTLGISTKLAAIPPTRNSTHKIQNLLFPPHLAGHRWTIRLPHFLHRTGSLQKCCCDTPFIAGAAQSEHFLNVPYLQLSQLANQLLNSKIFMITSTTSSPLLKISSAPQQSIIW